MVRTNTTPEEFVTAWQGNGSLEDVATALGCSKGAAVARAKSYIKRGVELRTDHFPRTRIDTTALNDLIVQIDNA
ncbi:MAG: hypothetical protein OES46_19845 [Gammaproteobacteria bacterium]|nr:hypothetical protein [Gammaproteobacteria bacterium]